jgi:glycosyltransferase involved in cell wall biosynthesis
MANVSICIPTFNRKDYLAQTLDSVYAQTYPDYKVFVVDDGSTDGTADMIRNAGYKNLTYHWQANAGDAAARNKLIELAQGQFIVFLDSDDLLTRDAVERMIRVMEKEGGQVVVYGSYIRIDQDGNACGRCKRKLYSGYITKHLFEDIIVHSCGSMFPTRLLRSEGGFDTALPVCSDYDLWLRLSLKTKFIALPDPTFKRRRHGGNLSEASSKNKLTELGVLRRFYNELGDRDVIPETLAKRRFSREEYRVGKSALQEHNLQLARCHFRQSFREHPNVKALLMWMFLSLKQKSLAAP